jgi:hypothetical protein
VADDGAGAGEVRLAEVSLSLQADGTFHGLAAFDVVPGTLRECPLELPGATQLVQVYVAGQPVAPEPRAKNHWQIPLLLGRLTQAVEVLFTGRIDSSASPEACVASPRLGELPVRQTLWRIHDRVEVSAAPRTRLLTPLQAQLVRLRNVLALANVDPEAFGAEPEELYCWHRLYALRLDRCRAGVDSALAEATWAGRDTGEPPQAIRGDLGTAQQYQSRLERWLAANPSLAPSSQDASLGPELQFLWNETSERGRTPTYALGEGWLDHVQLACRSHLPDGIDSPARQAGPANMGLAGLACLIALALFGLLHVERFARWVRHSAYLLAGMAGVGWWFFLWPGFFGALLIATSIGLGAVHHWQRARRRAAPATISLQPR